MDLFDEILDKSNEVRESLQLAITHGKAESVDVNITLKVKTSSGERDITVVGELPLYTAANNADEGALVQVAHGSPSQVKTKYYMRCLFNHVVSRLLIVENKLPPTRSYLVCKNFCAYLDESQAHGAATLSQWLTLYERAMNIPLPFDCDNMASINAQLGDELLDGQTIGPLWQEQLSELLSSKHDDGRRRLAHYLVNNKKEEAMLAMLEQALPLMTLPKAKQKGDSAGLWSVVKKEKTLKNAAAKGAK